jgi:hypothetical protein
MITTMKFHGNLHIKYASSMGDSYVSSCDMVKDNETMPVVVTYNVRDINWLGQFWFRDVDNLDLVLCTLDRWYSFSADAEEIWENHFILANVHVLLLDDDTDLQRACKRRSLRLGA